MNRLWIEDGALSVRKAPKPRRKPGHALLRLICGGICNTDVELLLGYYGFAGQPGHEFVAEVVGSDDPKWMGKRVVGGINLACGSCPWCAKGLGRHCPSRTVLGIVKHPGAFADYFTLPETNLVAVPSGVETRHAVFAEPVAAACEILDQVRIPRGARVAVLGDGKLGLLAAQVLAAHGAEVHQFGRHAGKLAVAAKAGIAVHLNETAPRAAFGFTVEATGSANGLSEAIAMTAPRGTVILKSPVHGSVTADMAPVVVNEITLVGSRCGRIEQAVKLIRSGKLLLDDMICGEFPIEEGPEAFLEAQRPGTLKVLLWGNT
jgi:alcohol dehydrogenase